MGESLTAQRHNIVKSKPAEVYVPSALSNCRLKIVSQFWSDFNTKQFESTKLLITAYAQLGNCYFVHGVFVRFVSQDVQ